MRLSVIQYGDLRLLQEAKPVEQFDSSLKEIVQNMIDTLLAENALGLAAQHLDVNLKIIVINVLLPDAGEISFQFDDDTPPLNSLMPLVLINPSIDTVSEQTSLFLEGSISFPDIRGDVERPTDITVTFQDLNGLPHKLSCNGLLARCIQHEVDHLENILYTERMNPRIYNKLLPKLKKLKRNTRSSLKKK